jgi:hypothetical protein
MKALLAWIAVAAGLAALTGIAQAKGPMEMEVSGGGLEDTVRVEGEVSIEQLYPLAAVENVRRADLKEESPLTVTLVATDPNSGERIPVFDLEYYPETEEHPAAFNDATGNFVPANYPWAVPAEIEVVIEGAGASLISKDEAEGGTSAAWLLIPAGLVGLVAIGGASGYLRRRSVNPESEERP